MTAVFVGAQFGFAVVPFLPAQTALAANNISATDHEGQEKVAGVLGGYTNGNVTEYTEEDSINYRFDLESDNAASGKMQVEFTSNDTGCLFYDGSFNLGTHDGSASTLTSISGSAPVVTLDGPAVNDGSDWVQVLNVTFAASGSATVNYYLTLSDEAGECSSGSPQHSRLANAPVTGDFKTIGQQNVSIPASQIIELPEIFVEKWVDTNADGQVDRRATAGEWSFSLDDGAPVPTDANGKVTFTNVTPDGNHSVTESNGPAGQTFLSGSGTRCTFTGSTATANVAAGTTSTDATCIFNNGVPKGSIKIVKNALPNNLTDFSFTASGTGVSGFTLDDDSGVPGADSTYANEKLFSNLAAGQYTFTESAVSGWDLTNISCPNATIVENLVNRTVTITLAAGQNVTCTFENKQRGQIIVTKQTNPDGDPAQFSITAAGSGTIEGTATRTISDNGTQTYVVTHGTYNISEQDQANWTEDVSQCQGLTINGNTPLVNGIPTLTCTITNTKLGSLTIIKNALPDDAQDFLFNVTGLSGGSFSLDDDADATLGNQKVYNNLPAGSYSVTEQSTPGWALTSLVCDNQTIEGATANIQLTPGQHVTCTFTNTKLGSISGIKYTADANGALGPVLSGWTIYIDSNNNGQLDNGEQSDVTDGSGAYAFENLLPGNYVLKEVLTAGWTQIFGTSAVDLTAGQTSTSNNFGNFQNGSINGFKWNDKNADGVVNVDEEKLNGWTITLFNDNNDVDTDLNNQVAQTTTAGEGAYSFSNLSPGTYAVCETQQPNWVQTYPANNQCHTITIDLSGESNQANFGNQGRGGISVVKNVDTDGDGVIDEQNVTNWTWDINGTGNYATGSTNVQSVAAGTYTVSEDHKTNYHVTASSCSGETAPTSPSETLSATVSPGETVTCTFTNTRDTAFITVNKVVNPTNDSGKFNLHIDGERDFTESNVGHGGTTGAVRVPTGTYTVSETAGTGTSLSDYTSSHECVWNELRGGGDTTTSVSGLVVTTGDNLVCTFTNVRKGSITIIKDAQPNSDQAFKFTGSLGDPSVDEGPNFTLVDDGANDITDRRTFTGLEPGTYTVTEPNVKDWDLESIVCTGGTDATENNRNAVIKLQPGENVTCTFTNTKRAEVTIEKDAYPADGTDFNFSLSDVESAEIVAFIMAQIPSDPDEDFVLDDDDDNTLSNTKLFTDLPAGTYEITEKDIPENWNLTDITCEGTDAFSRTGDTLTLTIANGDTIHCVFENKKDSAVVVNKYNDLNRNGWQDENEPLLPDWEFTLEEVEGQYSETQSTDSFGQTTFNNVTPDSSFTLTENLEEKDGWHLSNIYCDNAWEYDRRVMENDAAYIYTRPGETVTCSVGNYKDAELLIEKSNDQPSPIRTGTTVTYTITVSVPEDSGAVFDAVIRDVLPTGFTYVTGSANLTPTVEPTYNTVGEWHIGDLYPGDSVTLTYEATIDTNTTAGTYKNLAYAEGCAIEEQAIFYSRAILLEDDAPVCDEPISTDFVESAVTVSVPQVLGASVTRTPAVLADTGTQDIWRAALISIGLITITVSATIIRRRHNTGGIL